MILGIIPARGGSKGLLKKNISPLLGKPLIGYTIEAAQSAKKLDHLVVSTEDSEISEVCSRFGIKVIDRPPELATDECNIDGALKHAVKTIEQAGCTVEIVVWMQANFPLREEGEIDAVIEKLIKTGADSVCTMSPVGWPLEKAFKFSKGVLVPYFGTGGKYPRRQDYPEAYIQNGGVYAMRRDLLMEQPTAGKPFDYFFGKNRLAHVQTKLEFGIEIDNEQELILAEMFLERQKQKKDYLNPNETSFSQENKKN